MLTITFFVATTVPRAPTLFLTCLPTARPSHKIDDVLSRGHHNGFIITLRRCCNVATAGIPLLQPLGGTV